MRKVKKISVVICTILIGFLLIDITYAKSTLKQVVRLPATKRVADCLRILKDKSLPKNLRQQYITLFASDVKSPSSQYAKSLLDIQEDLLIEILLEGLTNDPKNQDIVF